MAEAGLPPAALAFESLSYDVPPARTLRRSAAALLQRTFGGRGGGGGGGGGGGSDGDVEAAAKGGAAALPGATRILQSVTGCVRRGESLMIIGPSGAGKTTLLHCMAGRAQYPLIGGQVLFDGRVRDSRTKRRIGYCTQDDIFFTKLTVRETLDFTAAIRMEGRLSKAQRQQRVDEIVLKLRLSKCLDTRIGDQQFDKGISGGERKRVNIANELLGRAEGGILLLDEPTSGLDSSSALMVVRLLRQLADEGHAIVSTLHQPTSQMLQLFDTVLMLSEGEVVYFGPTAKATGYFSSPAVGFPTPPNYNPADFFMQLLIDDDIFAPDGGVAGGGGDRSTGSTGSDVHAPVEEDGAGAGAAVPRGAAQPRSGSVGSSASQEVARHYLMRCWRQHGAAFLAAEYPEALAGMGVSPHGGDAPRVAGAGDEATRRRRQGVAAAQRVFQGPARAVAKRARGATGRPDPTGMPDKYATGWTTQVRVLGLRALRQKRGALVDGIQLAQLASIIVICALFWFRMGSTEAALDDRLGALFFFNVFFAFFSTFSALFAFPAEKAVLNKDRASGTYRLSAYYLAKTCVEIPADMLYPSLFAIVVYFAIDLNAKADRFFIFVAILIGITLTAQSMGLAISAAMMNVRQAQVLSSVLILTSMLIGGFYVDRDNIPKFMRPFSRLSYIKYAYAAFVRNETRGRVFPCVPDGVARTVYSANGARCPITSGDVLRGAQLDESLSIVGNLGVLLVFILACRFLGYVALKYLHRPRKERLRSQ